MCFSFQLSNPFMAFISCEKSHAVSLLFCVTDGELFWRLAGPKDWWQRQGLTPGLPDTPFCALDKQLIVCLLLLCIDIPIVPKSCVCMHALCVDPLIAILCTSIAIEYLIYFVNSDPNSSPIELAIIITIICYLLSHIPGGESMVQVRSKPEIPQFPAQCLSYSSSSKWLMKEPISQCCSSL